MTKDCKHQGESMGIPGQSTEAVKSAPKASPKKARPQGKDESPAASQEKASQAPEHKGQKNRYGGPWKGDHPSEAPASRETPFKSSHTELDGHKPKAPTKRSGKSSL